MLIDIDMNLIRFAKNIPDNYWKEILNVYKEYIFRKSDDEYDEDPADIFDLELKVVNNKYIEQIILSQGLSSIDLEYHNINKELLIKKSTTMDILFTGKMKKLKFHGVYPTKGYYDTKTIESAHLF
jgi:hypothetical protein